MVRGQVLAPATASAVTSAAPASTGKVSDVIPEMKVGTNVYYNARVLQVTALMVVFAHRDGIVSVPMADLPADLQKRFNYDPAKASAEAAKLQAQNDARKVEANAAAGDKGPPVLNAQEILQRFGSPPKVFNEVNMQPRFDQLGIGVKNQGARPSCAVFALVSALEYQRAPAAGPAPEFSEEYLIWATLKTLGKLSLAVPKNPEETLDIGFSLNEVAESLTAYGIALAAEVPYHFVMNDPHVIEPPTDVIERAKKRSPVDGFYIPGREPKVEIPNIIQVLNAGVPVVAGIKWPVQNKFEDNALLDAQPGVDKNFHAILLVGYMTKTGKMEDAQFIFKNSYGEKWGERGYGFATYKYLLNNLQSALFLDAR
jgi:C1A family cysteine protease